MKQFVLTFWKNRVDAQIKNMSFVYSLTLSLVLLVISLIVNFFAGEYAARYVSNPVTDIILSNVPTYNLDELFVEGAFILILFITLVCLNYPKKAPFALKTIALFTLTRSIFITLTHIGPFPTRVLIDPASIINYFTFGGDLFFSGHTGLPFLLALVFWDHKVLRYMFIATSIFFAIVVLLAHLHYSIDVFAAFFITYTIYHIAEKLFKHDKKFFELA